MNLPSYDKVLSDRQIFWHFYKKSTTDVIGLIVLFLILIVIFVIPYFVNMDPYTQDITKRLLPPSWVEGGELRHFLGTDEFGRDFLSRLLHGGANTIAFAFLATVCASAAGIVLGILTGIDRHHIRSSLIRHSFDIIFAVPSILIVFVVVSILSPPLPHASLAIAISLLPRFIHTTYNAVKHEIVKDYIKANLLDGSSYLQLTLQCIIPNILSVITINFWEAFAVAVLDISAIGYLGLGAQAPEPEWGSMLISGMDLIYIGNSKAIIPGIAIGITIAAIAQVGHGIGRVLTMGEKNGFN